jgi:N-acetyl-anhydromuramyl-L-alanine amidase AmpD
MAYAPSYAARAPAPVTDGRKVDLIVVHCSATPNGRWVSTLDIDHWHAERGFKRQGEWRARQNAQLGSIGYHFVIYTNGAIATGRHLAEVGAHVAGHNRNSIGICTVGTDKFSLAQWSALAALVAQLQKEFPGARVTGHRNLSPDADGDGTVEPREWTKTCPGFDVEAWVRAGMVPPAAHVLEAGS